MITSILYRIKYDADKCEMISCKSVGVITTPDVQMRYVYRVFDKFTVFVNTNNDNNAIKLAMNLIESWVA